MTLKGRCERNMKKKFWTGKRIRAALEQEGYYER